MMNIVIFFFKQKTAYEMRISDWSSDVCSSDLRSRRITPVTGTPRGKAATSKNSPAGSGCACDISPPWPPTLSLSSSAITEPLSAQSRNCKPRRSEEHTSELQSLIRTSYDVFCLTNNRTPINNPITDSQHMLNTQM